MTVGFGHQTGLLSAREQAKLGLLVPHRHHVQQRRAAGDLSDVAVHCLQRCLGDHGPRSVKQALSGAVIDQASRTAAATQPEEKAYSSPTTASRRGTPKHALSSPRTTAWLPGEAPPVTCSA